MKVRNIILLLFMCICLVGCKDNNVDGKPFLLEDKYYGEGNITEITTSEFDDLLDSKESFGLFIYQDFCAASASFEEVLLDYIDEYNISFYKLSYNDMKETKLKGKIKFYPSFVIYNDGKLISFLDADSGSDADYYKSVSGFNSWLTKYVIIPEVSEE